MCRAIVPARRRWGRAMVCRVRRSDTSVRPRSTGRGRAVHGVRAHRCRRCSWPRWTPCSGATGRGSRSDALVGSPQPVVAFEIDRMSLPSPGDTVSEYDSRHCRDSIREADGLGDGRARCGGCVGVRAGAEASSSGRRIRVAAGSRRSHWLHTIACRRHRERARTAASRVRPGLRRRTRMRRAAFHVVGQGKGRAMAALGSLPRRSRDGSGGHQVLATDDSPWLLTDRQVCTGSAPRRHDGTGRRRHAERMVGTATPSPAGLDGRSIEEVSRHRWGSHSVSGCRWRGGDARTTRPTRRAGRATARYLPDFALRRGRWPSGTDDGL